MMRVEMSSKVKEGDKIKWRNKSSNAHLAQFREGIVLERRGRNILVDMFGMTDWLYFPDLSDCFVESKGPD